MPKKKTHNEFINEINKLVGNEYAVLSEYINNKTKIEFLHNKCNNKFKMTPSNFLNGQRCPICNKSIKKTTDEYKKEIFNKVGNEYTILDAYINNSTKIKMKHNKCNNIYEVTPINFNKGKRCPYCKGGIKITNEDFIKKVNNLVGKEYTVIGEYINCKTKIKIKHNKCNNIYIVRPDRFIQGDRCPYCKESKGEKKVELYLNNNDIKFIKQKKFKNCKYKRTLPFDFYLEDYNICIEYDGIQHFKKAGYDTDESFELRKKRDNIKNEYCKNNNIKLIRIPYNKINEIDIILDKELHKSSDFM